MAERALVKQQAPGLSAPAHRTAPKVATMADDFEREADRTADAVVEWRSRAKPGLPLAPLPSGGRGGATGAAATGGAPLDPSSRNVMEPCFGYDFSRVRIHTDDGAARSAEGMRAQAYTSGTAIVFARGAYAPHSPAGQHLIAHELTHVVQQSEWPGLVPAVQLKPTDPTTAPPAKWYQEAIDAVDLSDRRIAEDQKRGGLVMPPPYYDNEKAILSLCEAVDRQAKEDVPKKLDQVLKLGLWVHLQLLSRNLLTELTARMYEMGLDADSERLRKAYAEQDRFGPYNDDIYAARRKVDYYTRLVSGAISAAKFDSPDAITAAIHQFVRAFVPLRDEYLSIDMEAVERERNQRFGWMVMRPGMSHQEFFETIERQIQRWQEGLSTFIQQAMDTARRDLESPSPTGSGATLLKALRLSLAGELHDMLFPKDETKNIAGVTQEVTRTRLTKGKGTIEDAFPPDKTAPKRSVPIDTYDPDQQWVRELRASLARFWRVRMDQLDVIGRIYGITDLIAPQKLPADTASRAEQAKFNADVIKKTKSGRLRLDSDDDWRDFVLQKYREMTKPPPAASGAGGPQGGTQTAGETPDQGPGQAPAQAPGKTAPPAAKAATPAEALRSIIELLFAYMQAFTVHARFTNIYDIGETSYINRPFPRALTGQLVHDCGVYALRAAYILSLVRMELGLRFRFVVLPVHVSLVISGKELPTFVTENDQFKEYSNDELFEKWKTFKDGSGKQPAGPADDAQFIGELAASEYIVGPVDMPFRVTDLPESVKDAKTEEARLWAFYQKTATSDVFGPSSQKKGDENYLFHQHYLALTEETRQMRNETFLPFWNNAAPDAWDRFQKRLAELTPPKADISVDQLMVPLGEYRFDFTEALKPVKARLQRFENDEKRLSERLRADPKLAKAGVRLSVGARAASLWHYYWDEHAKRIDDYEQSLIQRPSKDTESSKTIFDSLKPPFIPRDEKKLEPTD
jgi:hypothetical protein